MTSTSLSAPSPRLPLLFFKPVVGAPEGYPENTTKKGLQDILFVFKGDLIPEDIVQIVWNVTIEGPQAAATLYDIKRNSLPTTMPQQLT